MPTFVDLLCICALLAAAPWCGHCKRLAPVWKEFAQRMKDNGGHIKVAKFDCTLNRDVCSREGVRGYPTVRIYRADGRNYTFTGPRTVVSQHVHVGMLACWHNVGMLTRHTKAT